MSAETLCTRFVALARQVFQGNLTGVYLHGSAAMDCYNPEKSDLDLLVVVQRPLRQAEKRAFMDGLIALHEKTPGKGIEMSIVTQDVCSPFVYPTPFELHFSETHLDGYLRDPEDYILKMQGTDKDLAAHCTVIRARGRCLCGLPIEEVFGAVPVEDYIDALWYDVENAPAEILENPLYMTLNLARVLAYLEEAKVLSKREGGLWALEHLPITYHPLIQMTLEEYAEGKSASYDPDLLTNYAEDLLQRIRSKTDY